MENKIYFVRPRPENNWDNQPVFLVCHENEKEVWKCIEEDFGENLEEEYMIQSTFSPITKTPNGIIWSPSKIVEGN